MNLKLIYLISYRWVFLKLKTLVRITPFGRSKDAKKSQSNCLSRQNENLFKETKTKNVSIFNIKHLVSSLGSFFSKFSLLSLSWVSRSYWSCLLCYVLDCFLLEFGFVILVHLALNFISISENYYSFGHFWRGPLYYFIFLRFLCKWVCFIWGFCELGPEW